MNTGMSLSILDQQDVCDCAASGLRQSILMCPESFTSSCTIHMDRSPPDFCLATVFGFPPRYIFRCGHLLVNCPHPRLFELSFGSTLFKLDSLFFLFLLVTLFTKCRIVQCKMNLFSAMRRTPFTVMSVLFCHLHLGPQKGRLTVP